MEKKIFKFIWLGFILILAVLNFQTLFSQNYKGAIVQTPCATPGEVLTFYRAEDTLTVVATCTTDVYGLCSVTLSSTGNYKIKYGTRWRAENPWTKILGDTAYTLDLSTRKLNSIRFADRYTSIQSALNDLPATGGTVIIPEGTFEISSPLIIFKPGTILKGVSSKGTVIKYTGATADFVVKTSGNVNNFVIEDLCIEGNSSALGGIKLGEAPWILDSNNVYQFDIKNVLIKNFSNATSIGIYLLNITHGTVEFSEVLSVVGTHLKIEATNNNTGVVKIDNCKFGGYPGSSPNYGIELIGGILLDGIGLVGCYFNGVIAGIRIDGASSVNIHQGHFDLATNSSIGVLINSGSGLHIAGNLFGGRSLSAVKAIDFARLGETRGIVIEGNAADQFNTANSYLVRVAASGYSLQNVLYSPFSTASSSPPYILDSNNQLDYTAILADGGKDLYLNQEHTNNNVTLYFGKPLPDSGFEYLIWDKTNKFFTFSKQMRIEGDLSCKGNIISLNYASDSSNTRIYFNNPTGGDKAYLRYETAYHNFSLDGDSVVNFFNSGWLKSETDVRSKYHMSLNVENIDQNAELRFHKPTSGYETLKWNKTSGRFDFSNKLYAPNILPDTLKIPSGTIFPTGTATGQIFYKTVGDTLGIWNGSAWRKIATQ